MKWEAPILDIMLEFLHTFVIKSTNIYFGYKDKVYVINKQPIVNVFGVYVKDPKGQVGKTVALQALQSCKIKPTDFTKDQWNAKNLGLPYLVRYKGIQKSHNIDKYTKICGRGSCRGNAS
jgi:hypothetical protein